MPAGEARPSSFPRSGLSARFITGRRSASLRPSYRAGFGPPPALRSGAGSSAESQNPPAGTPPTRRPPWTVAATPCRRLARLRQRPVSARLGRCLEAGADGSHLISMAACRAGMCRELALSDGARPALP